MSKTFGANGILRGLGEPLEPQVGRYASSFNRNANVDDEMEVWDLVGKDCGSIRKLVKQARKCFRFLKPWERRSLSLNSGEKALLDALMATVENGSMKRIKSPTLLKALAPIIEKLLKVVGKTSRGALVLMRRVENVGEELVKAVMSLKLASAYRLAKQAAVRISQIAQAWGNRTARIWAEDSRFIRYLLAMMSYRENFPGAPVA